MADQKTLLSVIIPVYNEASTIAEVINKVSQVKLKIPMEIVVVDDGSTDDTPKSIRESNESLARTYFSPVNVGKGAAVRIGLTMARGDIILIQDADLELDPNEYERLITPILDGEAEVVYGSRFLGNNPVPFVRRQANRALTLFTNLLFGTKLTDMETAYKVFTSSIASRLNLTANRFEIEPEITAQIAALGIPIREVPISYRPRTHDEGKKINWRDGFKAVAMLLRCWFRFRRTPR